MLLGPRDDLPLGDPSLGLDFEAEVAVILGDTPRGTPAAEAAACVRLLVLANDVTLRNLVPAELAKGFGFFQSKPATAFSPLRGDARRAGRGVARRARAPAPAHDAQGRHAAAGGRSRRRRRDALLVLRSRRARRAHARAHARGRSWASGTVSNADPARGVSCLAERRAREIIAGGAPVTPFLAAGDTVAIEMLDAAGRSLFGRIEQRVVSA